MKILIIGGSGDIGRALCSELVTRSAQVLATCFRHPEAIRETVQSLSCQGSELTLQNMADNGDLPGDSSLDSGSLSFFSLDTRDYTLCENWASALSKNNWIPDVLIYNSGVLRDKPLMAMEEEDWQFVMDTNLTGAVNVLRSFGKFMTLQRGGKILLMSSAAALKGGRGQANYAASKAGLEALGRSLAAELARKDILVNMIAPGPVESAMTTGVMGAAGNQVIDRILLRRLARPEEIASFTAHMCSPDITYITGQTFHIDGGFKL